MKTVRQKSLSASDWQRVLAMWNVLYPVHVAKESAAKIHDNCDPASCVHYCMYGQNGQLNAWLAVFDRANTRWFSILVDENAQGQGLGKALIAFAKTYEPVLSGWVVNTDAYLRANGEAYHSPLAFYEKLGFSVVPHPYDPKPMTEVVCVEWRPKKAKLYLYRVYNFVFDVILPKLTIGCA